MLRWKVQPTPILVEEVQSFIYFLQVYYLIKYRSFVYRSILSPLDKNPQQHVPLKEYSENLKEISRFLTSAGVPADKVIFITPPPIHEPAWEKECVLKGNLRTSGLFSSWFPVLTPTASCCVSTRMSSKSAQLGGRTVRSGVCSGGWSVWVGRPGPLDAHAERRTSEYNLGRN